MRVRRLAALVVVVFSLAIGACSSSDPSSAVLDPRGQGAGWTAWIQVSSSNLEAIRYNADDQELDVKFLSGSIYRYFGVSQDVFDTLLHPPGGSHGEYFYDHIRTDYPYEKL